MHKFLINLLITVLPLISPELKGEVKRAMEVLKEKAAKTPNKFDDILVDFLQSLLAP